MSGVRYECENPRCPLHGQLVDDPTYDALGPTPTIPLCRRCGKPVILRYKWNPC